MLTVRFAGRLHLSWLTAIAVLGLLGGIVVGLS